MHCLLAHEFDYLLVLVGTSCRSCLAGDIFSSSKRRLSVSAIARSPSLLPPPLSPAQLLALPSKREGLFAPEGGTLIARSDTNGEDLEGYAGAGLYDR